MWISHFAPALILSRYSPSTPIWALAMAGALPDFLFFVFALLGIETIKFADKAEDPSYESTIPGSSGSHCFPYDCDYPYSHSIPGMIVIGLVWASAITLLRRLPSMGFATLFFATLTHIPLDLAVHRHDIAIVPSEPPSERWGIPTFDFPAAQFYADFGIFLFAMMFHMRTANPEGGLGSTNPRKDATKAYIVALVVGFILQADFSFFGAPTQQARWVHGPIFIFEILAISYGLQLLENHTDTGGKLQVKSTTEALKKTL